MKTQAKLFEEAMVNFGENTLLKYFGFELSYAKAGEMVDSLAAQMSQYVSKGDVVAVSIQNVPQFVLVEYAVFKLGAVLLPINPALTPREVSYLLRDSESKVAICLCESSEKVEAAAESLNRRVEVLKTNANTFSRVPEPYAKKWCVKECQEELDMNGHSFHSVYEPGIDDPAMLVYTSGTTGYPKAAVIKHKNIYAGSTIYRDWFRVSHRDKFLGVAPFFHITGLVFHIATAILTGASICCCYRFEPELALNTVEREKTTLTMAAATVYTAFLNSCDVSEFDLSSMRLWSSGGMAVSKALEERWRKATGKWIYVAWGLTETTSPATLWPYPYEENGLPLDEETMVVSSGVPVFDTQLKLINDSGQKAQEIGEICVKGPQVIDEYWKNPEATNKTIINGWLYTGDVAKIIRNWVFIIDRKKDLINASGFKVWPREVEEVLCEHPDVVEAVVIGVPDPYRGETVKAFVRLKHPVSDEEFRRHIEAFCRLRLAPYKVPKVIEFVNEVPKTASGKILRRAFKLNRTSESGSP